MEDNNIIETLKDRGLVITEKRIWIINAICRAGSIINVETFWLALRADRPVSWATIYNILRIMTEHGILIREKQGRGFASYRLAAGSHRIRE